MNGGRYANPDQTLFLEVAADGLAAYLTVLNTGTFVDENHILSLLDQAGVRFGLKEAGSFIEEQNLTREFNKPFPVALGEKPVDATAEFSLLFDPLNCYKPDLHGDDLFSLACLDTVEAGQPLAHLFLTRTAKTGRDIRGEVIPSRLSDDDIILKHIGQNVFYSRDRSQIIARAGGYPYMDEDGRLQVKTAAVHQSDLDSRFSDMHLASSLTVEGSVLNVEHLQVAGNLVVHGDVKSSDLQAGGNINVQGGITDCPGGLIAGGNLGFTWASNALLTSGRNISFTGRCDYCTLAAEQNIDGAEESGVICGGVTRAGEKIMAAVLGSPAGLATELEITVGPFLKECAISYKKRLRRMRENGAPEEEQRPWEERLADCEKQLEEKITLLLLEDAVVARSITAFKIMYPQVNLRLLKNSRLVDTEMPRVVFSLVGGELKVESY